MRWTMALSLPGLLAALAAPAPAAASGWKPLDAPLQSHLGQLDASPTVAGLASAGGPGARVVTRVGGASWTPLPERASGVVADADPAVWWTTDGAAIQRCDDGGLSWRLVP